MGMEIRQYRGNTSWKICVFVHACACKCLYSKHRNHHRWVCYLVPASFIHLFFKDKRGFIWMIHYLSSQLIQTLIFGKKHNCQGFSLHYVSRVLYLLLETKLKSTFPSSTAVTHLLFRSSSVHWLQINGRQVLWWIQPAFIVCLLSHLCKCLHCLHQRSYYCGSFGKGGRGVGIGDTRISRTVVLFVKAWLVECEHEANTILVWSMLMKSSLSV